MPEKILGLDIGSGEVKAVLLSRGFRGGYRVLGFRRIGTGGREGIPGALRELFADKAFQSAACVTALPPRDLSFRSIRLPFRDDRKIRQTLHFALEPLIQTPIEEVFVDYAVTGRAEQTEIFSALAPRTLVGERMTLCQGHVREMAVIDIDAVPLALRLAERSGVSEPSLLLDIGARDATAIFAGKGGILHLRHVPFGGEQATRMIAKTLGIDDAEAETIKRGGILPQEAAAALRKCYNSFFAEIRNTERYLLWQGGLARSPLQIFLAGGGSLSPGLAEGVAELFDVTAERTDLLASGGFEIDEAARKGWDPAVMDQALALASRPMGRRGGFNFRQREFEARAGYGEFRDRLKKIGVAAGVILALAGIEIGLDDYGDRLRLAALKEDIQTEFRRINPEATRIVDPVAQLRGKIAEAKKVSTGLGDATSALTALDLLREISTLAPAELLVTSFTLEGSVAAMKGRARNFDAVETIKKSFANSKQIRTATIDSTNLMKEGDGVEFDMKIVLKK